MVWGEPIPAVAATPKLVLCADIVFDELHFENLSDTICTLLPLDGLESSDSGSGSNSNSGTKMGKGKGGGGAKGKGKRKGKAPPEPPHALFSYRVRERCARHGCDTEAFFEMLQTKGFVVEDVPLDGDAAKMAFIAAQVTPKARQDVRIRKVFRKPLP